MTRYTLKFICGPITSKIFNLVAFLLYRSRVDHFFSGCSELPQIQLIQSIVLHYSTPHASDTLVLYLQLLHDGYISGGTGSYDIDEDVKERLPEV